MTAVGSRGVRFTGTVSKITRDNLCDALLLTPTRVAGVRRSSASDCVCVCVLHSITKTNDPKVFKLGIGNDLGMS